MVDQCLASPVWFSSCAAALQGLLALLGIAIAIYVPWRQRRNERQDRKDAEKRTRRSLAVALIPELEATVERLQQVKRTGKNDIVDNLLNGNTQEISELLEPDEQLESLVLHFSEAGEAGEYLQDGYYALLLANRRLTTAIKHPRQPGKSERESQQSRAHDISGRAFQAEMKFREAISQMREEFPDIQKGFIYGAVDFEAGQKVDGSVSAGPGA